MPAGRKHQFQTNRYQPGTIASGQLSHACESGEEKKAKQQRKYNNGSDQKPPTFATSVFCCLDDI
jgi:hypothetical protein